LHAKAPTTLHHLLLLLLPLTCTMLGWLIMLDSTASRMA
jgi:hypothetical protein